MDLSSLAGVVFDCDGTLADTESLADRAWAQTLATRGYEPTPADFAAVIGRPFGQNWDHFAARADLGDRDAFYADLRDRFVALFESELQLYDDAIGTLRAVSGAGVPVAVASSSRHDHVVAVLERGGVRDLVQVVVGADDVERHKPDPLPYTTAADRLGVDATRCTAVEDTPVGVASAKAAGTFTVAVVRSHGRPADLARADRVVDRLDVASLLPPTREPAR